MRRSCSHLLLCSAAVTWCVGATAGAAVTAEFLPPQDQYVVGANVGFDAGGSNTKFGQGFLAMTSGALDSLQIGILYHNSAANGAMQPLHIAFYDITDSTPGFAHPLGPALCEWEVPAASIPADTYPYSPTFTYSGPTVPIIAGRSYAFVLGTAFSVDFNAPYSVAGSFAGYDGGDALRADGADGFEQGWDMGFRVDVIVPTPGGLAAFGLIGLALARRRR
ncbi:MAG: hypothetical protein JNK58_12705 [Phycisphaerae bacterium]|nr:hypothetical protein [Phycisphaerae bacterium]